MRLYEEEENIFPLDIITFEFGCFQAVGLELRQMGDTRPSSNLKDRAMSGY